MKYRKFLCIGPKAAARRGTSGKWMASLASALLLCACAGVEPESEDIIFSNAPVSFDAFGSWDDAASGTADTRATKEPAVNPTTMAATRATSNGSETTFDNGDAIGVMAYYIPGGGTMDATTPNFMYNQKVTYATSAAAGTAGSTSGASEASTASWANSVSSAVSGVWTYAPVKYWPVSGKVNFYAYWPYAESGGSHISLSSNTAEGLPTLSYTNKNADIDLMAASSEGLEWTEAGKAPTVSFSLRHLLAKVRFKFTMNGESDYYPVVHILKYDVPYSSGSLQAWDKEDNAGFWTDLNEPVTIERKTLNVAGDVVTSGGITIEEFTAYLLPCGFPSKNGTDVGDFTISLDNIEYTVSPSSLTTVSAGKTYTINFQIQPKHDGKFFITSFSMWEDGKASWKGELK